MGLVRVSASLLKVLLGMMFVISAVAKFIGIDIFEVYIYSFGLFPLTVSFYVARLVIAFELILGAALISHRNHRFSVIMSLLYLIVFIVFLTYAHLIGRTDNCHCFGEMMPFDPVQSILKNAVLVLLLLFVYKHASHDWAPRWWLVIIIYAISATVIYLYMYHIVHALDMLAMIMLLVMMCVGVLASFPFYSRWYVSAILVLAPLATTFILSPPDSWFFKGSDEVFNKELFSSWIEMSGDGNDNVEFHAVADSVLLTDSSAVGDMGLTDGRHIVAFFSPNCGYCWLAAGKLSTIVTRHNLDGENIVYIFPKVSDPEKYNLFYENSRSARYSELFVDKRLFLKMTRGSFPLVLLVEDGEVTASFAYRNIDELMIVNFLENKEYK